MVRVIKCFVGAVLPCWAVCALCQPAWGQASLGQRPIYGQIPFPINPNPTIAPGVGLQQYAFNTVVLGRAYRNIPPYLLGYNPYPQFVNFGPAYGSGVFQPAVYNPYPNASGYGSTPPYNGGYNSSPVGGSTPYYGGNAYTGGYTAGGIDPLTGKSTGGGYGSYGGGDYSPQSYAKLAMDVEQARILGQYADQARLDTRKKLVDPLAYVRANEYTFTQQQTDLAKRNVERVRKMPTTQEVASGKSLNILIEDLAQLTALPVRGTAVMLDDGVLKSLNVTGQAGGSIGLLRDNGRFAWPAVFDDKNVAGDKEKQEVEVHAQELFQQAVNAKIDKNALKDTRASLRDLRASLRKNVKEITGKSFVEGLRFLNDFDAAVLALEKGDAMVSLDFQQKFATGRKTVQELVEYMTSKALRFAPANAGDERAYQIVHTALAAHGLALHNQISTAAKE